MLSYARPHNMPLCESLAKKSPAKLAPLVGKVIIILFLSVALSGCGLFKKKGSDPLPGKRIAVAFDSQDTEVDPSADGESIKIPAPYVNDFWLQPSALGVHAPQHLALEQNFKEFMRYSIGSGSSDAKKLRIQPIYIDNSLITVDTDFNVKAFNVKENKLLWQVSLPKSGSDDEQFGGGITFSAGKIFITTGYARMFALGIDKGEILYSVELAAPSRTAPSVLGEYIYVLTIDSSLTAYSADTGAKAWSYKAIADAAGLLGGSNPAVDQGTVFVGFSSGEVTALRAVNGQVRWHDNLASGVQTDSVATFAEVAAPIIISGNNAYAIANSNRFVAINIRTGGRLWTRKIGSIQAPWLAGDYFFLLSNNAKLLALSLEDGKPKWANQLEIWQDAKEKTEPIVWVGPILAGGQLIIFNQFGLMKIYNPINGVLIRDEKIGKSVVIPPIIADSQMFVLTDDGTLIGYK